MPVKRIQLRGLSSSPSDRMTVDGGLAESINMLIEQGENAPAVTQEDKTFELLGNIDASLTPMYIHTVDSYVNYIMYNKTTKEVSFLEERGDGVPVTITVLSKELKRVSSIGNTILLQVDGEVHYCLYMDYIYKYLGNQIPKPKVEVTVERKAIEEVVTPFDATCNNHLNNQTVGCTTAGQLAEKINIYASKYGAEIVPNSPEKPSMRVWIDEVSASFWSYALNGFNNRRAEQQFGAPVFLRYALKLYDGSYIYQSSPQLVGAYNNSTMRAYINASTIATSNKTVTCRITDIVGYTVSYKISMPDLMYWKDIVQGVSVFRSTEILNPLYQSRIKSAVTRGNNIELLFDGQNGSNNPDDFKREALKKSNFYLVEDITSDKIPEQGWTDSKFIEPIKDEELVVKRELKDFLYSSHYIFPTGETMALNERIIYSGIGTTIDSGPQWLGSNPLGEIYQYKFYIRTESGKVCTVVGRNPDGDIHFRGPCLYWIYYPDPRCFKVEMYARGNRYEIPMTEHPFLHGAYYYEGAGRQVTGTLVTSLLGAFTERDDDRTYYERNKVTMSEFSNPFVIPTGNRISFDYEVLASATTTRALSQGQFGQFPLYVFTKGGIWSIALREDGTFAQSVPLSRDVALSEKSITPIDQAVVFVTDNGVKLLSGSDIQTISPNMIGENFTLTGSNDLGDSAKSAISGRFSTLIQTDKTTFLKYMKEAVCGYDYNSSSLIFFNPSKPYQYIYRLTDATWHKYKHVREEGTDDEYDYTLNHITRKLNSYPNCLLIGEVDQSTQSHTTAPYDAILEFSLVPTGASGQRTSPGVLITRGIDLDEADIRKAIKSIRIRGKYTPGHVQYLLMGSIDGENYALLPSLRGGSYKVFRLILLCDLEANERISYIEIDYENRLVNRLR